MNINMNIHINIILVSFIFLLFCCFARLFSGVAWRKRPWAKPRQGPESAGESGHIRAIPDVRKTLILAQRVAV